MKEIFIESNRVCRGLVCFVVEGKTKNFQWSATPALLMADLHRAGLKLRKPPAFNRRGIMGSGGPDWWRNDYEFCVCTSKGRLPWANNVANGHPPKYPAGGPPSHRTTATSGYSGGDARVKRRNYKPPTLANAGNVISGPVGGGHMGSKFAHENEAPFPEWLVEPYIKCYCPPGGLVLDPFCGSGTTLKVAENLGRNSIGWDIRQSQIDLTLRRLGVECGGQVNQQLAT